MMDGQAGASDDGTERTGSALLLDPRDDESEHHGSRLAAPRLLLTPSHGRTRPDRPRPPVASMSGQIVVGLVGLNGCGKSTVAGVFEAHGFLRIPFAGPLKAMLHSLLWVRGMPREEIERHIYGDLKEAPCPALNGRTARHAMQTLGTEWGRQLMANDFWVDAWRDSCAGVPRIVVDDVRFPNEAAAVRALGGRLVKVTRQALISGDTHVSETLVTSLKADSELRNAGGLEDLDHAARNLIHRILLASE